MNQNRKPNDRRSTNPNMGWDYFIKNKTAILLGFAIGTTLSIVLNMIENVIIKIALIIYGS